MAVPLRYTSVCFQLVPCLLTLYCALDAMPIPTPQQKSYWIIKCGEYDCDTQDHFCEPVIGKCQKCFDSCSESRIAGREHYKIQCYRNCPVYMRDQEYKSRTTTSTTTSTIPPPPSTTDVPTSTSRCAAHPSNSSKDQNVNIIIGVGSAVGGAVCTLVVATIVMYRSTIMDKIKCLISQRSPNVARGGANNDEGSAQGNRQGNNSESNPLLTENGNQLRMQCSTIGTSTLGDAPSDSSRSLPDDTSVN